MEASAFEQVKHIINFGGKPDINEPLTAAQISELAPLLTANPVYLAELKTNVEPENKKSKEAKA